MDKINNESYYSNNYVIKIHDSFYEALCVLDQEYYLTMWPDGEKFVKQSNCKNVKIMINDAYPDFILAVFVFDRKQENFVDFRHLMAKFHIAFQIKYDISYLEFCNNLQSIIIESRERRKEDKYGTL